MTTMTIDCQWCGNKHGKLCPQIKAIEYFENGKIKRVEFKSMADFVYPQPNYPAPVWPSPYSPPWIVTSRATSHVISSSEVALGGAGYVDFVGPRDPSNQTHCDNGGKAH